MDLLETDDHFVLRADLPGVAEADVQIEVEDSTLTVSGNPCALRSPSLMLVSTVTARIRVSPFWATAARSIVSSCAWTVANVALRCRSWATALATVCGTSSIFRSIIVFLPFRARKSASVA